MFTPTQNIMLASPLPFGVHGGPDKSAVSAPSLRRRFCLHCLSAFTAVPTAVLKGDLFEDDKVSIAFRRSRRSRLQSGYLKVNEASHSLHCLSAFTAVPTQLHLTEVAFQKIMSPLPFGVHGGPDGAEGLKKQAEALSLHCLSAFTAVPTRRAVGLTDIALRSPLPFGVHGGPDFKEQASNTRGNRLSLHCLSAFTAVPTKTK